MRLRPVFTDIDRNGVHLEPTRRLEGSSRFWLWDLPWQTSFDGDLRRGSITFRLFYNFICFIYFFDCYLGRLITYLAYRLFLINVLIAYGWIKWFESILKFIFFNFICFGKCLQMFFFCRNARIKLLFFQIFFHLDAYVQSWISLHLLHVEPVSGSV